MDATLLIIVIVCLIALWILLYFIPVRLWFTALVSGVHVSLIQLALMRWRHVPPRIIVQALIGGTKAGLVCTKGEYSTQLQDGYGDRSCGA